MESKRNPVTYFIGGIFALLVGLFSGTMILADAGQFSLDDMFGFALLIAISICCFYTGFRARHASASEMKILEMVVGLFILLFILFLLVPAFLPSLF